MYICVNQVDVKEVSRQLNREREKLRVTEMKLQELKDQQLSLSFLTQGSAGGRRFTSTHRGGAGDGKKVLCFSISCGNFFKVYLFHIRVRLLSYGSQYLSKL